MASRSRATSGASMSVPRIPSLSSVSTSRLGSTSIFNRYRLSSRNSSFPEEPRVKPLNLKHGLGGVSRADASELMRVHPAHPPNPASLDPGENQPWVQWGWPQPQV